MLSFSEASRTFGLQSKFPLALDSPAQVCRLGSNRLATEAAQTPVENPLQQKDLSAETVSRTAHR